MRTNCRKKYHLGFRTLFLVLFFVCPLTGYLQNTYWTQQFGAKSTLMGGAVIGGVRDNSALFYNPAGIGGIDSANVNISANVYGFESINLRNGAGTNLDLNSFRILIYPQLISGLIKFKKAPKLKMVYGLLTRFRGELKMHVENRMVYDAIPSEPGPEYYYAAFDFDHSSISQWGGLGLGYKVSPHVYIGITNFVNYSHFDYKYNLLASCDVYQPSYTYITQITTLNSSVLDNVSLLWKAGIQLDFNKFKMGLTVTTPSVNIFGISRISRRITGFNQDLYLPDSTAIGSHESFEVADDRSDLPAQFKTPLSIALGLEGHFPRTKTRLTFTFEYFFPINKYKVAKSDSAVYIRPVTYYGGAKVNNYMRDDIGSAGVFNAAIGLSQEASKGVVIYTGIRTDFNNIYSLFGSPDTLGNSIAPSFANYIHLSGGVTIRKGQSDITLGFNYGYGFTTTTKQVMNITEPGVYNENISSLRLLQGLRNETMVANVHNFSLVLGYTYYMKRLR